MIIEFLKQISVFNALGAVAIFATFFFTLRMYLIRENTYLHKQVTDLKAEIEQLKISAADRDAEQAMNNPSRLTDWQIDVGDWGKVLVQILADSTVGQLPYQVLRDRAKERGCKKYLDFELAMERLKERKLIRQYSSSVMPTIDKPKPGPGQTRVEITKLGMELADELGYIGAGTK